MANVSDMREILQFSEITSQLTTPHLAVREVAPLLARLLKDRVFLERHVFPLADGYPVGARGREPFVACTHDGGQGAYSLQVFVWPARSATQIHDHSCWGAFGCAGGSLFEERYERVDNGERPNEAHLKKAWQREWKRGDAISTLLPYDGGIHRVSNPGDKAVLSLNIYGPFGPIDGRDYDPLRDYACDRVLEG